MLLLAPLTLASSSCSRIETLLTEPIIVTVARCPPLTEYTPEQQAAAGKEQRALPKGSVIADFIGDYGTLRAKCRAYEKK